VAAPAGAAPWRVLWTRSHCERAVRDQLAAKGFTAFLPMVGTWARRKGGRYVARVPMFPGYLFLRHALDKSSYLDVCKAKGLVQVLGERWDRLASVPDGEIEGMRKVSDSNLPVHAHPYLREGQRARVLEGPLAGAVGILRKTEPARGELVLSVELLRRSVAVQVDCTMVEPE
jgi:transcription antitermination factor NusG